MAKRIDHLTTGAKVTLRFHANPYNGGGSEEQVTFIGISGEGDERRASFRSYPDSMAAYDWQAYRYQGHWAYGTSADRLSLVSVDAPDAILNADPDPQPVEEAKRTPYDIAHKLVGEYYGEANYRDDFNVTISLQSLRALLIEAATQARA